MPHAFFSPIFFLAAVGILASCGGPQNDPVATLNDPVEGIWKLTDETPPLRITPCGSTRADGFCGYYLVGDSDKIDWMNPDLFEWGQSLQTTQIVRSLRETDKKGTYTGTYYSPSMGEYLLVQLTLRANETADAKIYFGPMKDEAIDMAISAALAPVSLTNLTWYLTRATLGKELLHHDQKWVRLSGGKP
jgi:hypothetical protein